MALAFEDMFDNGQKVNDVDFAETFTSKCPNVWAPSGSDYANSEELVMPLAVQVTLHPHFIGKVHLCICPCRSQ